MDSDTPNCMHCKHRTHTHAIPLAHNEPFAFTAANLFVPGVKHPRFRVVLVLTPWSLLVTVLVLCFAALLASVTILTNHKASPDQAVRVGRLPCVYI